MKKETMENNSTEAHIPAENSRSCFRGLLKKAKPAVLAVLAAVMLVQAGAPAFADNTLRAAAVVDDNLPSDYDWDKPINTGVPHVTYRDQYCMVTYDDTDKYVVRGTITILDTSVWDGGQELTSIAGHQLSDLIRYDDVNVSSIKVEHDGGIIYDNTITVHGHGRVYLKFTDLEHDTYGLTIGQLTPVTNHTVWYNSTAPRIAKIEWEINRHQTGGAAGCTNFD